MMICRCGDCRTAGLRAVAIIKKMATEDDACPFMVSAIGTAMSSLSIAHLVAVAFAAGGPPEGIVAFSKMQDDVEAMEEYCDRNTDGVGEATDEIFRERGDRKVADRRAIAADRKYEK